MTNLTRPVPVPDDQSAQYWRAAAAHSLVMPRCPECGELSHPPDIICPHCLLEVRFEFVAVSGRGAVRSWTVLRKSFLPGFDKDLPFVLVDVELEEKPELRLIGRLMGGLTAALRIGAPVTVAFEDLAPGIAIPAFALGDQ